jgi:predicted phosphodiesterase
VTPLPAVELGEFERVALLADVHGNAAALRAVLADVTEAGVDAICLLGCFTWGPEPRAVLDLVADRRAFFLRGNGERAVLELADGVRAPQTPTDEWMVGAHGSDGVGALRTFPAALTLTVGGVGRVRLCHGSPRSDVELLTPATPAARIEAACAGVAEPTVVHGHTHLQYARHVAGRYVAGCGSVGLPYYDGPPGARWTLLGADLQRRRTPYDVAGVAAAIRAGGYPGAERYAGLLEQPPTPDEIVADAEPKQFSD